MATIRKTITVTDKQDEWIKSQINNGDFTNESEYIRALIRREQGNNEKFLKLKSEIQKGLDSGISDRTLDDIWAAAEQKHKAKNG
ncbi:MULTISPECIES: type II toxin-antitoxin system ParD family antitoxin [Aquimarina]|uniref:type II toxin-antitoxin system ParD family antitoxin n=1 Tax=Aquimarina TaxID=290174 RepID=UPI000781F52E|nr:MULTISPECIES: type II toxin-antitoxin system ParD family antitoxin [Aquimarina]